MERTTKHSRRAGAVDAFFAANKEVDADDAFTAEEMVALGMASAKEGEDENMLVTKMSSALTTASGGIADVTEVLGGEVQVEDAEGEDDDDVRVLFDDVPGYTLLAELPWYPIGIQAKLNAKFLRAARDADTESLAQMLEQGTPLPLSLFEAAERDAARLAGGGEEGQEGSYREAMADVLVNRELARERMLLQGFDPSGDGMAYPELDAVGYLDRNALHWASLLGHVEVVKYLLSFENVPVNAQDGHGMTPLHHACAQGHLNVVVALIIDGHARLDVVDNVGETPDEKVLLTGDPDEIDNDNSLRNVLKRAKSLSYPLIVPVTR